ncbi:MULTISPECIES: IclR family transcriptional regulator [Clostridium]|uniref:Predicted transcriptional regulator, IclR family n=4 Tax=Clostridium TaxID=1485 RepID=D8GK48_CLOLD|nr:MULTISPECIES: IclR family transcriptional regulator [Clostridium]ADK13166.1 predicted transcriptional regulator, IclR family [Clostridium ljungdahlii DSM 13528]AGY76390.1 IclR family transcriptional regulator [Clostridium autoethanogenum DSM 10061]ALU36553.1 Transcriptional regulator IclR family [Clostridium autoethanogenum DSM 10061]OAA84405.1 Transcriptional regulator KdgR [Clostridium ljungdahlii DSM 13528]OVY48639.1 Transcriptional regulator KdgR [Clostridium autoethanogenum]
MAHKPTERVLNILNLLSVKPKGLTLTEISEAIDVPKSTLYPIIQTMLERNFLSLEKSSLKYSIGISTFCIGASYSRNKNMLDFIQKIMKNIVSTINETCQMGILDGYNVLYILKEDPIKDIDIRLISYVGKRIPAYCTALGKALLSEYNIEEIKTLYPDGLKPITKNTITDFSVLEEELKKIRETHVATEVEEVTEFLRCYAVPLTSKGKTTAAISISIPTFRATEEKNKLAIELLLKAKEQIDAVNLN